MNFLGGRKLHIKINIKSDLFREIRDLLIKLKEQSLILNEITIKSSDDEGEHETHELIEGIDNLAEIFGGSIKDKSLDIDDEKREFGNMKFVFEKFHRVFVHKKSKYLGMIQQFRKSARRKELDSFISNMKLLAVKVDKLIKDFLDEEIPLLRVMKETRINIQTVYNDIR